MITWCASECGNLSCGFNAEHCRDKTPNYVYMKNNIAMHCVGWEKPEKEKRRQNKGKTKAKTSAGRKRQEKKAGQR